MSERLINQPGMEVSGPSTYRAKLANNVTVKCVGVINDVKVKVCGVEVAVDVHVMPSKGEGYLVILGRPLLIAMQAKEDLETGLLVLKPQVKDGKKSRKVVYNMKEGLQEPLEPETSMDEISSKDY